MRRTRRSPTRRERRRTSRFEMEQKRGERCGYILGDIRERERERLFDFCVIVVRAGKNVILHVV